MLITDENRTACGSDESTVKHESQQEITPVNDSASLYGGSRSKAGLRLSDDRKAGNDASKHMNVVNVSNYLHDKAGFSADVAQYRNSVSAKTGFDHLDAFQPLFPGFYSIGAISGLGKTTFMLQMCDQIAEAGMPVLYFTLEQSAPELVCKSLARRMYLQSRQDPERDTYSSMQIRFGEADESEAFQAQLNDYANITKKQCIVECNGATVEDIIEIIREYSSNVDGGPPVVVIDYLQIIQKTKTDGNRFLLLDERQHIDYVIEKLKDIQMEMSLVLICICSVNRANYLAPIGFESFKSSGNIEFTSDVVWGLQLRVVSKPMFLETGKIVEKRKEMDAAKGASPREVELVVLKNRFGRTSTAFYFDYYAEHDTYIDRGTSNSGKQNKTPKALPAALYYRILERALAGRAQ